MQEEIKVGDKLEVNKEFKGIMEVTGKYPSGQGNVTDHYSIMVDGQNLILSSNFISSVFRVYKVPTKQEKPVEKPVEKVKVKKIVKKPSRIVKKKKTKVNKKGGKK